MQTVDDKIKQETYEHYKALILSYYHDRDILVELAQKITDGVADKSETVLYQMLTDKLNNDVAGKYEFYQVVTKDGTKLTKRKKISEGIYEPIVKDYIVHNCNFPAQSLKKLSDSMGIKDDSICCSESEYYDYRDRKLELEQLISDYTSELNSIKKHIRDYEYIHNKW